ncbi:MAG: alpha/beta fold hydrolase [Proteobacteria bacterium]|nr:alpha/beta fold hydrolase [Pseudomonadota bacterium]
MKLVFLPHLKRYSVSILYMLFVGFMGALLSAIAVFTYLMDSRAELYPWHKVKLDEEYTVAKEAEIDSFEKYLGLEGRLFQQLQDDIYDLPSGLPDSQLNRFAERSLADPTHYKKNWNRSFIMAPKEPRGGVLLLHGLSDSPYSLRALAVTLYEQGYYVLGLRMPGHGTAPTGLVHASWQDMASAIKLAAAYVSENTGQQPMYIIGYSMGAAQAVSYSLDALQDERLRRADALVLISPAIGVSEIAALAVWQSRLAVLLGIDKLVWNSIGPEYDPYKYTSFAVNAGDQMYRLTREIDRKMALLDTSAGTVDFPRTLALMSLADATVSTHAVVTHLMDKLQNKGNELVLFDINRREELTIFLKNDPIAEYEALLKRGKISFDLRFFTNVSKGSTEIAMHHWSLADKHYEVQATDMRWPDHVYSLSHVAMPFPPTDSLYGSEPEDSQEGGREGGQGAGMNLHIGLLETKGEKGVLSIHASDMLRLRYNPFYSDMKKRILTFLHQ